MGHKSPAAGAWWKRQERKRTLFHPPTESQEILATRRHSKPDGTQSHWPDFLPRARDGAESNGHHHYRMGHKNLTPHRMRSGRARAVSI